MTTSPTRRTFLQSSTLAAAALVANTFISKSAFAAASDTIKFGMIGCGGRCSGAARDVLQADPGAKLVAMCDLFPDRIRFHRDSLKKSYPDRVDVPDDRMFTGLDGYKHVIENVDVVLAANAAKFHPLHLRAAIEAGKHCFLEKPHAIDPVGVRAVTDACNLAKTKNLSVLSGLHSRHDIAIKECIQRVLDGQIGQIISIEENFLRSPYGTLFRAPGLNELHYQYSNQYRFGWLCGDDVTQSLIHNLDRATWALGETPPIKCHGLGGRSSMFSKPFIYGDVFDHHSVVYHYANGVRLYALTRTQDNCYNEDSSIIMGSKGIAYPKAGRITGEKPWQFQGQAESPYVLEHKTFFKAIRSNQPLNCGDYMAKSTLVAVMGQLSCHSGKEVTWDAAMKSTYQFQPAPEACTWDMAPPCLPDKDGIYPVPIPGKTVTI